MNIFLTTMEKISIVGSGVVGRITGDGLIKLGYNVIFQDVNPKRVEELLKKGYNATLDVRKAVNSTNITFISVPTPNTRGKMEAGFLINATKNIAQSLAEIETYHVVVVKSTVLPTTTENTIIPLLERYSGKKVGEEVGVCVNPEFLTEIHKTWTDNKSFSRKFFSTERVVIGEFDKKSGVKIEQLYKPLKKPIFRTDLRTAEMIKYASNCALANRISYWNEIYYICKKLDVDSVFVAEVTGMDARIGKYGTVHTKAFGGKCLPKDLKAFISFSEEIGHKPKLLKAVDEVNEKIKRDRGVRE